MEWKITKSAATTVQIWSAFELFSQTHLVNKLDLCLLIFKSSCFLEEFLHREASSLFMEFMVWVGVGGSKEAAERTLLSIHEKG
jgi:hypothetical protein